MKMLIGERVEGHVRLVGRIVRVVLVAAAMLAGSAQPASAQFIEFMEWLDRLSGPGPFRPTYAGVPSISIPLGCITEVTSRETLTEDVLRGAAREQSPTGQSVLTAGARDTLRKNHREAVRHRFEFAPSCLGLYGVFGAASSRAAPWGKLANGDLILRKKNRVAFEINFGRLTSVGNELEGYPPSLSEEDKRVEIRVWGFSLRYFAYDFAFLKLALNQHHFYSPRTPELFAEFDRGAGVVEAGFKPFYWGQKWGRPVTVSAGWRQGLGAFKAADFGSSGSWRAVDQWTPTFRIGYDIWWIPCLFDLCDSK